MSSHYSVFTVHPALGGLDISSDPSILDPNFLTIADNIEYLEGGQRKKRLGTQIYSTSTGNTNPAFLVSSSTPVRAVSDFWRYGASISPTQNLIAVAGASIFQSSGDGRWTALTLTSSFGRASNVQTDITLAGDFAVISDETASPVALSGLSLTSTSLVTPSGRSTGLVTVLFQATGNMIISTTTGFSVTSTIQLIRLLSSSDMTVTATGNNITSTSTASGSIFSLITTDPPTLTSASLITSTGSGANRLSTLNAVQIAVGSTMKFQELSANIINNSSSALTYQSTSLWSDWPAFTGAVYHLSRLFMFGLSTAPSNVNYTAAGNIFDSTGLDTGTFPVNVGDSDQVIGISEPFYASLYVFKGPQFGSIWQLSGTTPATFSMAEVGHGAPALNHRAIVSTPSDIYWLSQYGIHSLETTVKFGNVETAFLSLPIQRLWRDNLILRSSLNRVWGFWHPQRSVVGWCVVPTGDTVQRWILLYNYALSDPKPGGRKFWSIWKFPAYGLTHGAPILIPPTWNNVVGGSRSAIPTPFFGGENTGTVYVGDWSTLTDAGSAYTAQIRTPILSRFHTRQVEVPENQEKLFVGVTSYINPKGNYTADLSISVDQRIQSTTISLVGGGNTLT